LGLGGNIRTAPWIFGVALFNTKTKKEITIKLFDQKNKVNL